MDADKRVYLDHNATTSVRPQAIDAVCAVLNVTGNPSSVHTDGRRAHRILEDARDNIANLVGALPSGVIFTSGGTEANNLAMRGTGRNRLLVSAIEHPAVLKASKSIEVIPVDSNGIVDLTALQQMLSDGDAPQVVSVMAANNETGVLQPLTEIAELVHEYGALLHSDAVQLAGKQEFSMQTTGVDMVSLSAHKIGGPAGVGALVICGDIQLQAINRGGGQERSRRGGTENLSGIAGFGAAAKAASDEFDAYKKLTVWRDRIEIETGAVVIGGAVERIANTSLLAMPGVSSETQVMTFDLAGISVSAGSACSSGKVETSHVLSAMAVEDEIAASAVRISLGWNSQESDVERFVKVWIELNHRSGASTSPIAKAV